MHAVLNPPASLNRLAQALSIGPQVLIPQVVDAVRPVPVVTAGAMADGRGVAAMLSLAPVGVWCGTVFLLSKESWIHSKQKNQIVRSTSEEFVIDRFGPGAPARHRLGKSLGYWRSIRRSRVPSWMRLDEQLRQQTGWM